MAILAVLAIGGEYSSGMIRVTVEAMTVLARAGAAVAATDRDTLTVCGLAAERVVALLGENAVPFSEVAAHRARSVTSLTELRVVTGTGALLAVAAVLAVAIGTMLRRSAAAVAAVIVAIILPYVLATASPLPGGVSDRLLRLTPAAAFAVQQSQPQYPQVISGYPPLFGYYPLPAWAGFAVLCAYAALALGLAGRMKQALHAEWTKLRTAPGTGWLLLACIALTVALSTMAAAAVTCPSPAVTWTPPGSASPGSTSARRSWPSWPCWRSAASTAAA